MTYKETFVDSTGKSKTLELRFHREARMRYSVHDLETLFADNYSLLKEILHHHETVQRPRIQELLDYAEGNNHDISKAGRRRDDDMADTRAIHNLDVQLLYSNKGIWLAILFRFLMRMTTIRNNWTN